MASLRGWLDTNLNPQSQMTPTRLLQTLLAYAAMFALALAIGAAFALAV